MPRRTLTFGLFLTAITGTLDALAAILILGAKPASLFKFIAGGVFGKEAFAGGTGMIITGLLLHYLIAAIWSFFLLLVFPYLRRVSGNPFILAIVYGVLIWIVMNLIVLPLSNLPASPLSVEGALKGALILVFAVSGPLVALTERFYNRGRRTKART